MANICDYLRWRGDLSFEERPFNDVDNVILSALSYLDMAGIVPSAEEAGRVSVAEACEALMRKSNGDVAPYVRSLAKIDGRFVELLGDSQRFCNAHLRSYCDITDSALALQFSAITIELPHAGTYVSFRGTDNTLVGWRENFMLSFEVTEAQREATRYLERELSSMCANDLPVRVGGHSKGGNLAEYAALTCNPKLRERIERVYSNDGPCMAPEVITTSSAEELGNKLRRIVPSYSVVGMIFSREDDKRIVVASSETGVSQHDLTSWQVLRDGMDEVPQLQPECLIVNRTIAALGKGLTLEERRRVTNEVFDALEAGGATKLSQIADSPEGLQQVLRALRSTSEDTREVATTLVQSIVSSSMRAMRSATRKAFEETTKRLKASREGQQEQA